MEEQFGVLLKKPSANVREARLGSITGYSGNLEDIVSHSCCDTLKNRERCFSQ